MRLLPALHDLPHWLRTCSQASSKPKIVHRRLCMETPTTDRTNGNRHEPALLVLLFSMIQPSPATVSGRRPTKLRALCGGAPVAWHICSTSQSNLVMSECMDMLLCQLLGSGETWAARAPSTLAYISFASASPQLRYVFSTFSTGELSAKHWASRTWAPRDCQWHWMAGVASQPPHSASVGCGV